MSPPLPSPSYRGVRVVGVAGVADPEPCAPGGDAALSTSSGPNILLIVTDDQRAAVDTMSVMPKTRALFEDQGTNFPNYVVTTPLCCPSRSSIFSGRYAHNTGVQTNTDAADVQAFDQQATIQAYLHEAGYQTGIAGKFFNTWPVGQDPPNFDRWAIFGGGYVDPVFNVDGTVRIHPGYSTNVLVGPVRGHAADVRILRLDAVVPLSHAAGAALSISRRTNHTSTPPCRRGGRDPPSASATSATSRVGSSGGRISRAEAQPPSRRAVEDPDVGRRHGAADLRPARRGGRDLRHLGHLHVGQRVPLGGTSDRRGEAVPLHGVRRSAVLHAMARPRRARGAWTTG